MRFISHRGNIDEITRSSENTPSYIDRAIEMGYDVEVDVRYFEGVFYLGHDAPETKIDKKFLSSRMFYLWIHCKNIDALYNLSNGGFNIFSHDIDDAVLTSTGFIWTYPGKKLTDRSICVLPENTNYTLDEMKPCVGICSDYISKYKDILTKYL